MSEDTIARKTAKARAYLRRLTMPALLAQMRTPRAFDGVNWAAVILAELQRRRTPPRPRRQKGAAQ